MFHFIENSRDTRRVARRSLLQIGGVGGFGLSQLLAQTASGDVESSGDPTFGRAKNYIMLYKIGRASWRERV